MNIRIRLSSWVVAPAALLACALLGACRPRASSGNAPAGASSSLKAPKFRCNLLLGVAVTSEWFDAGFEHVVDDARWEAITKPHTSLSEWADPNDPVWSLPPTSACAERATMPDRVLFTAMKWEYKSADEWVAGLRGVVSAIVGHFPEVREIDLLTMIRAPHNASCGNQMSVVEPFVDEAVARVAAEQPALVKVGAKLEAPTCELFKNGGPHFTDAGRAQIAQYVGAFYAAER